MSEYAIHSPELMIQLREKQERKLQDQLPMQQMLDLPSMIHISGEMPKRELTVRVGRDRYLLRRQFSARHLAEAHMTAIFEVRQLGLRFFPVSVGWLGFREQPDPAWHSPFFGWFYISREHPSWVLVQPVWREGAYCQSLWDGVTQIVLGDEEAPP